MSCPKEDKLKDHLSWIKQKELNKQPIELQLNKTANSFYYNSQILNNYKEANNSFTLGQHLTPKSSFTNAEFTKDSILKRNWSLPKNLHRDYDDSKLKKDHYYKNILSKSINDRINTIKLQSESLTPNCNLSMNINKNHIKGKLSACALSTNMVSPANSNKASLLK